MCRYYCVFGDHNPFFFFFFFNDTATTEIYTLSLHDALPILFRQADGDNPPNNVPSRGVRAGVRYPQACRSRQSEKAPLSSTRCPALLSQASAIRVPALPFESRPRV